jgi:hypothetical protein
MRVVWALSFRRNPGYENGYNFVEETLAPRAVFNDQEEANKKHKYRYWMKIEYSCTIHDSAVSLISSKYGTETPDLS